MITYAGPELVIRQIHLTPTDVGGYCGVVVFVFNGHEQEARFTNDADTEAEALGRTLIKIYTKLAPDHLAIKEERYLTPFGAALANIGNRLKELFVS